MRERWVTLCERRRVAVADADAMFREIESSYARPPRAYHNLGHIDECLRAAEAIAGGPLDWRLELAIWMHDCIYEPFAGDNEESSAMVAGALAQRLGASSDDVAAVSRLILATRHTGAPIGADEAIIVDADLSILGANPSDYDAYAAAIRVEYAAVPEEKYRAGRRRFVEQMLGRSAIFATEAARGRWEARARGNLSRELQRLR